MAKALIVFLLITTILGGYYFLSHQRIELADLQGRVEKTTRGSLTLPITATGEVRPSRRVEMKAEASGEVMEIPKQPGDRIRTGDLIIRLRRDDEERSVSRASQDLDIAQARLKTARDSLEKLKTCDMSVAASQVRDQEQSFEFAKFQLDKYELLTDKSAEEHLLKRVTYNRNKEQLEQAKQHVEGLKLSISQAEQDVRQAEATETSAKDSLADAQKRLVKTDIVSPMDGLVGDIRTQKGEVIQGGKTTLTGGTVLAVLLNLDRITVRAEVDEADVGRVREIAPDWARPGVDSSVEMPTDLHEAAAAIKNLPSITVEACRGEKFEGVIERIYPEPKNLQGVTTYFVDVVVTSDNRDKLMVGMRAEVRFTSERVDNVVLVPNEAIREVNGKLGVYVPKPNTATQEKALEFIICDFGLDNGNYSEVRAGLTEGQEVYTKLPVKQEEEKGKSKRRT